MNFHQLEKKIRSKLKKQGIKIISFDVFDTLLNRVVPSDYVTRLAVDKLSIFLRKECSIIVRPEDIYRSRQEFAIFKNKLNEEWELREWLIFAAKKFNIYRDDFCKLGYQAEISAEVSCLSVANELPGLITDLNEKGIHIVAVSDIWLDAATLKKVLSAFGLSLSAVYTSGELKVSKKAGTIFGKIERDLNIESKNILHIGDNLESDFIRPRIAGWKSIWMPVTHPSIPLWIPKPFWKGPLSLKKYKIIEEILNTNLNKKNTKDSIYNLGYNCLGPLLILFSFYQYVHFKKQRIDDILFLARDAKLPFEVYKKIFGPYNDSPKAYYARLSRRAVSLLYPGNPLENANPLPGKVGRKNIGEWISNFAVESELKSRILQKANLTVESYFSDKNRNLIRIACKYYRREIESEKENQRSLLQQYIKEIINKTEVVRLGVVDSGWAGMIQDSMKNGFEKVEKLCGVYLGVSRQGERPTEKSVKLGLIRDDYRNCSYHHLIDRTAGAVRMWEILLREPIETILRLEKDQNSAVKHVFLKSQQIGDNEKLFHERLTKGVFQRIEDSIVPIGLLKKLLYHFSINDFERSAVRFSKNISISPKKEAAKILLGVNFDEGSAGGKRSSIGFKGLKNGVAWYPGIIISLLNEKFAWTIIFILRHLLNLILFLKNTSNIFQKILK